MQNISTEKRKLVETEMESGESLRWIGEPKPSRIAWKGLPITLFGIPFTAFSVFWIFMAADGINAGEDMGAFRFFPLFGIPFLLIGIGMLLAPLWLYLRSKKSVYAITSKRAIIFEGLFSFSIRSFKENKLNKLERRQKADGSGDIIFFKEIAESSGGTRNKGHHQKEIGFFGIPEVKTVEKILNKISPTDG